MRIITQRSLIQSVAERWEVMFPVGDKDPILNLKKLTELKALNLDTCSPDDVALITGNENWVKVPPCGGCGAEEAPVVEITESVEFGFRRTYLCRPCVAKALNLFYEDSHQQEDEELRR
jgi:hypothetical protein